MAMTDAYIGLGSNLDGPEDQLQMAIKSLQHLPATTLIRVSSFYRTRPVGPEGQPDYINAVVLIKTGLTASDLLKHMQAIEDSQYRTRNIHWGPRTLDLDLLLYGESIIHDVDLNVPHPELHKRGFVLYPLYEISPEIVIPGYGSIAKLLQNANPDDVQKLSVS
jgi:2-amino-4-hydroxy-6-hydroxymethyldihydropteridine diphosphokinase